jgi:hypothetical protein
MYDDQDRPPWLRSLRPPRPEPEPEPYESAPTVVERTAERATIEASAEEGVRGRITRRQVLLLALLLWGNVSVLGCLCLLATGTVQP